MLLALSLYHVHSYVCIRSCKQGTVCKGTFEGGNSKESTGGKPASEGREMMPAENAQASASNTAVAATMASNHTLILVLLKQEAGSPFFFPPRIERAGLSVRGKGY